jgi:hypothetical protein
MNATATFPDMPPVDPPAEVELAELLSGPDGGAHMHRLCEHLALLRAQLQAKASRGANSETFEQVQAALQAVDAARDILQRFPVKFHNNLDSPLVQVPKPTQRSTQ